MKQYINFKKIIMEWQDKLRNVYRSKGKDIDKDGYVVDYPIHTNKNYVVGGKEEGYCIVCRYYHKFPVIRRLK
jgi:hypothetical protein